MNSELCMPYIRVKDAYRSLDYYESEALPLLEDCDLVLPAPPGAHKLRALGKLDSRARP